MPLSKKERTDIVRRELLAMRRWMGPSVWKAFRRDLKREDPELYELTKLTSRREE